MVEGVTGRTGELAEKVKIRVLPPLPPLSDLCAPKSIGTIYTLVSWYVPNIKRLAILFFELSRGHRFLGGLRLLPPPLKLMVVQGPQ